MDVAKWSKPKNNQYIFNTKKDIHCRKQFIPDSDHPGNPQDQLLTADPDQPVPAWSAEQRKARPGSPRQAGTGCPGWQIGPARLSSLEIAKKRRL